MEVRHMSKELLFTKVVDDLGRVCLPSTLRQDYGISAGDSIAFYKANGQIIMEFGPRCAICKKPESTMQVNGTDICEICAAQIKAS